MPALSAVWLKETHSVLSRYNQEVLVRNDVADNIRRESLLVVIFHAVMGKVPGAYVQSVHTAQVSAYPYNFFVGIVIKCFHIIVRYTVASFLRAIPFEFACTAVEIVQAAAFGSYP